MGRKWSRAQNGAAGVHPGVSERGEGSPCIARGWASARCLTMRRTRLYLPRCFAADRNRPMSEKKPAAKQPVRSTPSQRRFGVDAK